MDSSLMKKKKEKKKNNFIQHKNKTKNC